MLYIRTLVVMLVSLYTSRIVLATLGVEDFGIYNVVGGVVTMMAFLRIAMASSIQRYLNYEMGKGDTEGLNKIFCMSMNLHILIALLVVILSETVGLWFVNTKLVIPLDRMSAANWVYQFSILAAVVSITQIPYMSLITAHEKMGVLAYISILTAVLKLLTVYLLLLGSVDKLMLYAILTFGVTFTISIIYRVYCRRKFVESQYKFIRDPKLFRELTSFAGWSLMGRTSIVLANQGIDILLNLFLGPVVNAARGISLQVNSALTQFVEGFQTAARPQIVKSYAAGEFQYFNSLIFRTSKFSFYLLFILSAPVLIETNYILNLWLKVVPNYTIIFCKLIIIDALIATWTNPLVTAIQATGRVKLYNIVIASIIIFNLPVSYLLLKIGYSPVAVFYVAIILSLLVLCAKLIMLKCMINFPIWRYLKEVVFVCIPIVAITIIFSILPILYIEDSMYRLLLVCFSTILLSTSMIYTFGLKGGEKDLVRKMINKALRRKDT